MSADPVDPFRCIKRNRGRPPYGNKLFCLGGWLQCALSF